MKHCMITSDVHHQNRCKGIDIFALLSIGLSRLIIKLSIISSIKPLLSVVKVEKSSKIFLFCPEKVVTLSLK